MVHQNIDDYYYLLDSQDFCIFYHFSNNITQKGKYIVVFLELPKSFFYWNDAKKYFILKACVKAYWIVCTFIAKLEFYLFWKKFFELLKLWFYFYNIRHIPNVLKISLNLLSDRNSLNLISADFMSTLPIIISVFRNIFIEYYIFNFCIRRPGSPSASAGPGSK